MDKIKVLICDDSALMRKTLERIINSDRELEVIGKARDGEDAVLKARELRPDVITMDINMPVIDGITSLQIIVEEKIAPVIMVSSLTQDGAITTFEALELGAFDYVAKPGGTVSSNMSSVEKELKLKIKAAYYYDKKERKSKKYIKAIQRQSNTTKQINKLGNDFKAVTIGISTGGPKTIFDVLPYLPLDMNAAVFIVQHMPPSFTSPFASRLDNHCPMKVHEAKGGMEVEPGNIYLAKGGYHLKLVKRYSGELVLRTTKKPDHLFIPSVDIMMESVLEYFGSNTIGVIMTGMGSDGAQAMVKIRQSGGITIAESEASSIVFGMPKETIARGGADIVVPSWEIASEIVKAVEG